MSSPVGVDFTSVPVYSVKNYNFSDITAAQLSSLSANQVSQITQSQYLALDGDVSGVELVSALGGNILDLSTNCISAATAPILSHISNFGFLTEMQIQSIPPAVIKDLSMNIFQDQQIGFLTIEQLEQMSTSQFDQMTPDQILVLRLSPAIVNNPGSLASTLTASAALASSIKLSRPAIYPLNINISAFNTTFSAPYFSALKVSQEVNFDYDAVVALSMDLSAVEDVFQYKYASDTTTKLYVDKTAFSVKYSYEASSNATKNIDASMYPNEPNLFGQHTFNYTDVSGLKWHGPVDSFSIPGDRNIPMSWDYLLYIAEKTFNNWAAFTLFEDISGTEHAFRTAMNSAINNHIEPVLELVDVSNASVNGAAVTKLWDASSNLHYTLLQNGTTDISNNLASTVFDYIFTHQPQRFTDVSGNTQMENTLVPYPFIVGDTLNFLVKVDSDHKQVDVAGTNVSRRTYLMTITIV